MKMTKESNLKNSLEILEQVIKISDDKLAQDIIALDVKQITGISDYFVIMQGRNDKHVQAIVDAIVEMAHKQNLELKNVEGRESSSWILIDLTDVIIHVFNEKERSHYNLEKLWHDAPIVNISDWID